eukprot:683142-Rhodomonas_salina.32
MAQHVQQQQAALGPNGASSVPISSTVQPPLTTVIDPVTGLPHTHGAGVMDTPKVSFQPQQSAGPMSEFPMISTPANTQEVPKTRDLQLINSMGQARGLQEQPFTVQLDKYLGIIKDTQLTAFQVRVDCSPSLRARRCRCAESGTDMT